MVRSECCSVHRCRPESLSCFDLMTGEGTAQQQSELVTDVREDGFHAVQNLIVQVDVDAHCIEEVGDSELAVEGLVVVDEVEGFDQVVHADTQPSVEEEKNSVAG